MSKITIDDIKKEASEYNWKLLSDEYKNLDTELVFECSEGHKVYNSWKKVRGKFSCPICEKNSYKETTELTALPRKKKGTKRILALDQATYISGYSIFDDKELITYGTFHTNLPDEIERDNAIREWLINIIHSSNPDLIVLEDIQLQQNLKGGETVGVTTFKTLARLQGILMEVCFLEGIEYNIVASSVWRGHCGVKGKARADKKKSAQILIKNLYDITVSNDEADAICIGKYGSDLLSKQNEMIVWG